MLQVDARNREEFSFGYVSSIIDSVALVNAMNIMSKSKPYICFSSGITNNQVADVIKKFLENNPENRNKSAYLLSIEAIHQSWPCE